MQAKIWNFRAWIDETDPSALRSIGFSLLKTAGFTIMNFTDQVFKPVGYTCVWVLAESHLAIHTFPEEGKTYIELSSCNKDMQDAFLGLVVKHFKEVEEVK